MKNAKFLAKSPILAKTLSIVAIMLPLFILFILTINSNWFDEALDPAYDGIHSEQLTALEPDNAYFAFMGFTTSPDRDMVQAGMELVSRYETNLINENRDELTDSDYQEALGQHPLKLEQSEIPACRARTEQGCADKLIAFTRSETFVAESYNVLFERYQSLITMEHYREPVHFTVATPLPDFGSSLKTQRLLLAYQMTRGTGDDFAMLVAQDLKFWRSILRQSETLIGKMIAIAAIHFDLQFIEAFAIAHPQYAPAMAVLLTELTAQERNIAAAFRFENRMMARELLSLENHDELVDSDSHWWVSNFSIFLFQPNATVNLALEYFAQPMEQLAAMDATAFYANVEQFKQQRQLNTEELMSVSPGLFYNPAGKLLVSIALINGEDYIVRVHELDEKIVGLDTKLQSINL